ncbi:MAG: hypothetical protein RRY63_00255 [Acidaminococcaceae bacterium]
MIKIVVLMLLFMQFCGTAFAAGTVRLEAVFPHNIERRLEQKLVVGSTNQLFFNLESVNNVVSQNAVITVNAPRGLQPVNLESNWTLQTGKNGDFILTTVLRLEANYCQKFGMLAFKATQELMDAANKSLQISVDIGNEKIAKTLPFLVERGMVPLMQLATGGEAKNFGWYINKVVLPVDERGQRDAKVQEGCVYVRAIEFENLRNRLTGEGATNWAVVHNHPATHLLLELANPQKDVKLLKFKAVLVDKITGTVVAGLRPAGQTEENESQNWSENSESANATTALIALAGMKNQSFILPLYIDTEKLLAGDYNLRLTVSGNGEEQTQALPITIAKKRSIGIFSLAFSVLCLLVLIGGMRKIKQTISNIGAKGAITVALFAAIAFGSVVLPTTIVGDFLKVFLGPFSSLLTGLLSGTLLYLLLLALLILYRKPGVAALFFLLKWLLSGIMFGRFTPLGILSYAVYIVVLEVVLIGCGFYRKQQLTKRYMFLVALLLGIADAFITLINLEQMMFFYRLYYADWYLALYMLVNGLIYSSIGSFMGYKVGAKLEQIIGE